MDDETFTKYFPQELLTEANESVIVATALHTPAAKENQAPTLVENEFHKQQKSNVQQQKLKLEQDVAPAAKGAGKHANSQSTA